MSAPGLNWAGNRRYQAARLHEPESVDELRAIVAGAPRIRVLGSRHSFNAIADSGELVSLARLPPDVVVDRAASTVSFGAGMTYGDLAVALERDGLALGNLASLPHISVAGAVATATHGSGDANGNLATAVAGLELLTSSGDLLAGERGDDDFDGLVVGLGALGAVTRVTLDVEPAYDVSQHVYEDLPWEALDEHLDAITASGYSVSLFTRWGATVEQVWVKRRDRTADVPFDARPATVERHPIAGVDAANTTPQLGRPGPWSDRLPHFRMGFTPSRGDELQSEFFVARADALDAIQAVRELGARIAPLLFVSEIRTIAADRLWLSPHHGRESVGLHFTWRREPEAVLGVLAGIERALAPFSARPHWGKLFVARAPEIGPLYERLPNFLALMGRLDPRGAFRNAWLEERLLAR